MLLWSARGHGGDGRDSDAELLLSWGGGWVMDPEQDIGADREDDGLVPVAASPRVGDAGRDGGERTYTLLSPTEAAAREPRLFRTRGSEAHESPWRRPRSGEVEPPQRSSRGRDVVLVLVAGVAAVAAFLAGRASAPSAQEATEEAPAPELRDGIPSGFSHDPEGAQSAAADYTATFSDATLRDAVTLEASLESLAAPGADFAAAAAGAVNAYRERLAALGLPADGSTRFRTYPMSVSLTGYGDDHAEVEVWAATVIAAEGVRAPSMGLVTYHFSLSWTGSDWLVADVTTRPGADGAHVPTGMDATPLLYEPAPAPAGTP